MRRFFSPVCALAVVVACGEQRQPAPRATDPAAAAPATSTAKPSTPGTASTVAVHVESPDEGIDPCSLAGARRGGGRVVVRAGPGAQYAVVDSLPPGATFSSCESAEGWAGIVYRREGVAADSTLDCGVSSPVPEKRAYSGPCRSGWIAADAVEVIAG